MLPVTIPVFHYYLATLVVEYRHRCLPIRILIIARLLVYFATEVVYQRSLVVDDGALANYLTERILFITITG